MLKGLEGNERLVAFRYHDLILLKNQSSQKASWCADARSGRARSAASIPGQRIVLGEQVLTYQDLAYYFNAKKNVSLTHDLSDDRRRTTRFRSKRRERGRARWR